jgi:hypothetical protein
MVRKILLTDYIGAMLSAVLIADAFTTFVTTLAEQLAFHFRSSDRLALDHLSGTYSVFSATTRIALYLGFAYFLWLWLYGTKSGGDDNAPPMNDEKAAD